MKREISLQEEFELIKTNISEIITEQELKAKLKLSRDENRPLRVKLGADPSAPDIHLGHCVILRKLRTFQRLGHHVIFIIGDFTGMIGDPSGRSATRPMLTREQIIQNARTYQEQIYKILDEKKTEVRFNSEWFEKMDIYDFLRLTSKYTVSRIFERDDFSERLKKGEGLTMLESLYPLIMAYDSVAINADIEFGGTDQKFNIIVGRNIQNRYDQPQQVGIIMPLIEGTDGVKKMSKSLGNYIAVNDTPNDIFGKVMSVPDSLIEKYMRLLTDIAKNEIDKMVTDMKNGTLNPRDAKENLGFEIVKNLYSPDTASKVREEFRRVFSQRKVPTKMPELLITKGENLIDIIERANLVKSKNQVKRLVSQGGIKFNSEKISDPFVSIEEEGILKIGKRRFIKIKIKK